MRIVGVTTQQEAFVASRDRNFRINEILVIKDEFQGELLGEIVETRSYNRYIPLNIYGDFVDSSVIESLKAIGYNIDEETIHIGKIRLLNEAQYPVETGAYVRIPVFEEVKDLTVKASPEEGLVLGLIKNTGDLENNMDQELKDILYTYENNELKPQNGIPFIFDVRSMDQYPHIGIFGGSGSGKSFGMRVILEELMELNIPTIVLDPHYEMDFSTSQSYLPDDEKEDFSSKFQCVQVGFDVGVNFTDLSIQDLKNLLDASSPLTDAMNNVVDMLYKKNDSYMSFYDRLKMLSEAQEEGGLKRIEDRISESATNAEREGWMRRKEIFENYDKTCPYSSVKGILWRLGRLNNDGIFNKDIKDIEEGLRMGKLIVIQGNTRMLQVFSTYLLNNLYRKRRDYKDALYKKETKDYFPPFFIVTDEAHNFAPKGYDCPSKSVLKEISQEGRKYGVFMILATQRPTLLDETITAQLNTKLIFRTVRSSDIQTIKEETDLTEEEGRRLPYLQSGDVFISSAIMGRTIFARIRASKTTSPHTTNPFDELLIMKKKEDDKFFDRIKDKFPINDYDLINVVSEIEKETGTSYTLDFITKKLDILVDEGKIVKNKTPFGYRYEKK